MVRTRCPSISKFRLGLSFPSFGSGGASFGDILWAFFSVTVVFLLRLSSILWLWVWLPCFNLDSLWAFFLSSLSPGSVWSL